MHKTVARARFQIKIVKQLSQAERLWKMRSAKGALDCSDSSISHKKRKQKLRGLGALLDDEVDKMCTRLQRELDFHLKMLKHCWVRSAFGR